MNQQLSLQDVAMVWNIAVYTLYPDPGFMSELFQSWSYVISNSPEHNIKSKPQAECRSELNIVIC